MLLFVQFVVFVVCINELEGLPYYYSKRDQKRSVRMSPSLGYPGKMVNNQKQQQVLSRSDRETVIDRYNKEGQEFVHNDPRMSIGLDTGNPAADHEASMWLMALIGTLAAAIPVAFLSPSLGFKKRSADDTFPSPSLVGFKKRSADGSVSTARMQEMVVSALQKARKVYQVKDL